MLTLYARTNIPFSSASTWTPFHHPILFLLKDQRACGSETPREEEIILHFILRKNMHIGDSKYTTCVYLWLAMTVHGHYQDFKLATSVSRYTPLTKLLRILINERSRLERIMIINLSIVDKALYGYCPKLSKFSVILIRFDKEKQGGNPLKKGPFYHFILVLFHSRYSLQVLMGLYFICKGCFRLRWRTLSIKFLHIFQKT